MIHQAISQCAKIISKNAITNQKLHFNFFLPFRNCTLFGFRAQCKTHIACIYLKSRENPLHIAMCMCEMNIFYKKKVES